MKLIKRIRITLIFHSIKSGRMRAAHLSIKQKPKCLKWLTIRLSTKLFRSTKIELRVINYSRNFHFRIEFEIYTHENLNVGLEELDRITGDSWSRAIDIAISRRMKSSLPTTLSFVLKEIFVFDRVKPVGIWYCLAYQF